MPTTRATADAAPGSGWFHVVDRVFLTLLVLSLACHFGLIAAVAGRTVEQLDDVQEDLPRWGGFLPPVRLPQPVVPVPAAPHHAGVAHAAGTRPAGPRPKLDHAGLLAIIGSATGDADSSIGDLLQGGNTTRDLADAFRGIDHVAAASLDMGLPGSHGDRAGTASQLGELGTGGSGDVDLGHQRETHDVSSVAGSVSVDSPEPESKDIDRDAMSRFVKAHLRSIQSCYERQLKLAPTLKGKLAVRLTLTPSGRVGDLEIDEDTLQNGAVITCIRSVLHGWQLPFHPEGDSAVQLSWNFVAAD
jgi:hypothetical protein